MSKTCNPKDILATESLQYADLYSVRVIDQAGCESELEEPWR
jgi:hypothetical protein